MDKLAGTTSPDTEGEVSSGFGGRGRYMIVETPDELRRLVEIVKKNGVFALDVETDSIDAMAAEPCGFSVSTEPGTGWYIPLTAGGRRYLPMNLYDRHSGRLPERKILN